MTSRRPQDPRTKKVRDVEAGIQTMGPDDVSDPNATVMPDQRGIETFDPGATVMPLDIEAPKPRMVRGGAAATRVPGATMGERTMTADSMEAARVEVRAKAAVGGGIAAAKPKPKKGASWLVWVLAFVVLGGIGFGVAWLLMNPSGAGEAVATAAAEDAGVAAEDASEQAGADAAGGDAAAVAGAGCGGRGG